MNFDKLETLLESGGVTRFHAQPTIQTQTMAEHQWNAVTLFRHFFPHLVTETSLIAIMYHDAAEIVTGDIPSPAKRAKPAIKVLLDEVEEQFNEEHDIPDIWGEIRRPFKICDILEGLRYTSRQRRCAKTSEVLHNWEQMLVEATMTLGDPEIDRYAARLMEDYYA